ncbi:hypothetical protein COCCADRAFT_97794 [Bipolaris zeicola 26-R-13]|uniref:Uncharacterized protein n=1 Tax=Cochliobolus carbonum (strain 26-R-13) TaxID=930089 RepID=W6Y570_COCC2|nr:uncharacterized protein COCCADRAFT_97794 [Bipolaris zeicola 26-R-13]EUC32780.1 hypothetical protein COCCADRAFT_97794 [Bipolaris zeicola 26-R-13]
MVLYLGGGVTWAMGKEAWRDMQAWKQVHVCVCVCVCVYLVGGRFALGAEMARASDDRGGVKQRWPSRKRVGQGVRLAAWLAWFVPWRSRPTHGGGCRGAKALAAKDRREPKAWAGQAGFSSHLHTWIERS